MDNSELIYSRLMEEAAKFTYPDKRIGTLERLKAACDAIASGEPIPASPGEPFSHRKAIQKINPSNIERVVRSKNWTGPKRSFIANKTNGVLEYVHAREEERVIKSGTASKTLPTQLESLLSEIHSIEVRQAMRNEIERRRTAEQEIKIIKEALKKLPQIDVRAFLDGRVTSDTMNRATHTSLSAPSEELQRQLRSLVERLTRGDLRRMGLKTDGGDILSINNAPVVLNLELKALIELAGLPNSLLTQE